MPHFRQAIPLTIVEVKAGVIAGVVTDIRTMSSRSGIGRREIYCSVDTVVIGWAVATGLAAVVMAVVVGWAVVVVVAVVIGWAVVVVVAVVIGWAAVINAALVVAAVAVVAVVGVGSGQIVEDIEPQDPSNIALPFLLAFEWTQAAPQSLCPNDAA